MSTYCDSDQNSKKPMISLGGGVGRVCGEGCVGRGVGGMQWLQRMRRAASCAAHVRRLGVAVAAAAYESS